MEFVLSIALRKDYTSPHVIPQEGIHKGHALGDWQLTARHITTASGKGVEVNYWRPGRKPNWFTGHIDPVRSVVLTKEHPRARVTRGFLGRGGERYLRLMTS